MNYWLLIVSCTMSSRSRRSLSSGARAQLSRLHTGKSGDTVLTLGWSRCRAQLYPGLALTPDLTLPWGDKMIAASTALSRHQDRCI